VLVTQVCDNAPRVLGDIVYFAFLGALGRKIVERRILNGTRPDQLHLRKIVTIGSGWYHSFAVDMDGDVCAWGLNQYGQLGVNVPDSSHGDKGGNIIWTPTEVPRLSPSALDGARVVQIDGGEHHTLFLLSDGRVFGVGRIDSSQLGLHADHPAMKNAKKNDKEYIATPTRILFPPPPTKDEPNPDLPPYSESAEKEINNPISKISVSGRGNLVVSKAGYVYSWGYGASCQVHFIYILSLAIVS
jgi:regulator of chromosome condensation